MAGEGGRTINEKNSVSKLGKKIMKNILNARFKAYKVVILGK